MSVTGGALSSSCRRRGLELWAVLLLAEELLDSVCVTSCACTP